MFREVGEWALGQIDFPIMPLCVEKKGLQHRRKAKARRRAESPREFPSRPLRFCPIPNLNEALDVGVSRMEGLVLFDILNGHPKFTSMPCSNDPIVDGVPKTPRPACRRPSGWPRRHPLRLATRPLPAVHVVGESGPAKRKPCELQGGGAARIVDVRLEAWR